MTLNTRSVGSLSKGNEGNAAHNGNRGAHRIVQLIIGEGQ